jgi:gamma-glutamylaminecyclotransferase
MTADIRLFVYGSLMQGEREHERLAGATFVGLARTVPEYTLVDLGPYPALVEKGRVSVAGEVYLIDKKQRFSLDVKMECPVLFRRIEVRLEDGSRAETYAMRDEQVRGKRRLANGDWRSRFAPRKRSESVPGPMGRRRPYGGGRRRGPS